MKKSDCRVGMRVWMKLRGQSGIATIRCMATEDVHLDWSPEAIERARAHGVSLPPAVGYQDLMPLPEESWSSDGQAPVTRHEGPDLDSKPRKPYKYASEHGSDTAPEASPSLEPVPQTDSPSVPPIRDQSTWPELWRRFERIVGVKRELLRQLRNTERPSFVFTSMADVLAASLEQDEVRIALVRNQQELTRLKLEVCEFLGDHYDYNVGPFIPPEPPTPGVDGTAPDAAR